MNAAFMSYGPGARGAGVTEARSGVCAAVHATSKPSGHGAKRSTRGTQSTGSTSDSGAPPFGIMGAAWCGESRGELRVPWLGGLG